MSTSLLFVILICIVAFGFDFVNGFHDSANSVATVVSTRVLRPVYAVAWAAFFNFAAAFLFPLTVASTIGKNIVNPAAVTNEMILAALIGAILWDLITWYLGLPTSSSHALIGGMIGAVLVVGGPTMLLASGITKTAVFIVVSPVFGMALGYALRTIMSWIFRRSSPKMLSPHFRRLQLVSAALYSLGHGGNDAQKTMGIVASLLVANHYMATFAVPWWIILTAHAAIALGTMAGGWRIIKTMGMKITKLQPIDGFCAETAAATSLFTATHFGIPVSTTHTITGAIVGVGSTRRLSSVRWGVTVNVVWAWVFTMPGAAFIAAVTRLLLKAVG